MYLRARCIAFLSLLFMVGLARAGCAGTVIAAMMSSDQPRYREAHRAFVKSMAARGYTPPATEIVLQVPNPDPLSWSNTIRKFNAYHPHLIVAYGASAAQAAIKEVDGIPVIVADAYLSEQQGRGIGGVSSRVPMVTLLRTLQEMRHCNRIGVLYNAREHGSVRQLEEIRRHANQAGIIVVEGNAKSVAAVEGVLNTMLDKVDLVVVTESGVICRQFERIVARAKARHLPVAATMPDAAEKGALISLEISPQEQGHLAAEVAARVLEGTRPESLTLLTPRRVDLIINLKVAKELGLQVPYAVLGSATRLIK